MKRIITLILALSVMLMSTLSAPVSAAGQIQKFTINGKPYVRTFYDEFGGIDLDDTKWERSPEYSRQNGYCFWSDSMTSVDGKGHLLLSCDYDDNGTLLTGSIRSKNRFYQTYGYFEISAKLQQVGGFWSAFWLMPDYIDYGSVGGADGTEMDIFEAYDVKNKKINHALHYDGYGENHTSIGSGVTANVYDGKYHNFAMEWDESGYTFFIDGKESYRITTDDTDSRGNKIQSCMMPVYLKISLESGSWTELPNPADMPSGIEVDYVKVYQRAEDYIKTHVVYGDIDSDLEIGVADVLILREYLACRRKEINITNANVYNDSEVDLKDCLALRKYLADEITQLPCKE